MSWFWFALCAAILWGLSYTINQLTLQYFNEIELLFFEAFIVFVILAAYFIVKGNFGSFTSKLANPKLLGLIISSGLIYVVASYFILKSITASNASLAAIIESSYPIFTVLFAFIFFGQLQLNLISGIGFILILSGIIIVKFYS
ncbi:EamA family transporter [Aquella oligotrophica]|uniref:EamA domain-containing protein n=1 Tax=Aquella oligotrophica TaxID=2067065 RepID=A0A2I7N846_9NEIS|nr:EamA family transporter [Aquella oligotrophica]AUR52634.1 hypothetical protein CUN60_10105 [Aquella oligotrophica]